MSAPLLPPRAARGEGLRGQPPQHLDRRAGLRPALVSVMRRAVRRLVRPALLLAVLLAVLSGVFLAYLNPHRVVELAGQLWSCF